MFGSVSNHANPDRRMKHAATAALLALALLCGTATMAQQVGAAAPQSAPISAQTGGDATYGNATYGADDGTAQKPNGGKPKNGKTATKKTHCEVIDDPVLWQAGTGYKADPDFVGGMVCAKY